MPHGSQRLFIGQDVGGTKLLTLVVNARGEALAEDRAPSPARQGPQAVMQEMLQAMTRALVLAGARLDQVGAVGVAFAGLCDLQGTILKAPHLAAWERVPLRALLMERLALPVLVGNDASLAAVAEHRLGAGRGLSNVVYLTVSTGIGAGIIADGRLVAGGSGLAGEAGHMVVALDGPLCDCGRRGCLEALASGSALAREARERREPGSDPAVTAERLFDEARRGDALAEEVIQKGARALGVGLANLAVLLDPEAIVVGGGLSHQWPAYVEPAIQTMRLSLAPLGLSTDVPVIPAGLGDRSASLGAALLAREARGPGQR